MNDLQPLHEWPSYSYTSGSQVHLCWRHLLPDTSWNLCQARVHSDSRPSMADTILSAMVPETKCFKDYRECLSLCQPPAERFHEWPATSIRSWAGLPWSHSRSDIVVQDALAKALCQAKEPKQHSVKTRRHNLGHTGQHTPHISFGTVLLWIIRKLAIAKGSCVTGVLRSRDLEQPWNSCSTEVVKL